MTKFKIGDIIETPSKCYVRVIDVATSGCGRVLYKTTAGQCSYTGAISEGAEVLSGFYELEEDNYNLATPPEYRRWRAEAGGKYWFIDDCGCVIRGSDYGTVTNDYHYSIGNYYKTEEECKLAKAKETAKQIVKDDAKGFEPNWRDSAQFKYSAKFDHTFRTYELDCAMAHQRIGAIYFQSKEDLHESLKAHYAEWQLLCDLITLEEYNEKVKERDGD